MNRLFRQDWLMFGYPYFTKGFANNLDAICSDGLNRTAKEKYASHAH